MNAIDDVFPDSPQRFCLRHIYANFQSAGFRGEELKKHLDQAAYSFTKHGHDLGMENLKKESLEAWQWLSQIPEHTWARYKMDTVCKTDLLVNNLSEVFNRMILDVRNKPIRTMLEGIRTKLMIKFQKIREKIETCRWEITPTYSEILEEGKKWAKYCEAYMAGPGIWQVTSSSENTYCVNLNNETCDCRRWDMTAVPYSHAIAAMQKVKIHPEDYVSAFFKKPMYCETYKHIIFPVPGPDHWPHTPGDDISPPIFREKKGKKQTARRKGLFEVPAKKDTSRIGTVKCSNCKKQGHRINNCGVPLKPKFQMRLNKHQVCPFIPLLHSLHCYIHFICRKIVLTNIVV